VNSIIGGPQKIRAEAGSEEKKTRKSADYNGPIRYASFIACCLIGTIASWCGIYILINAGDYKCSGSWNVAGIALLVFSRRSAFSK
jgi:hypothetical protein